MKRALLSYGWLIAATSLLLSCRREMSEEGGNTPVAEKFDVTLSFENTVAGEPLTLDNVTYTNVHGEAYTVKTFRYYISNLELSNTATGKTAAAEEQYQLVDQADAASRTFRAAVEAGTYNRIRFLIGIDSTRNVSGAQTGALDPAKGMFWTWNSGYVMAKLEGSSNAATTPNKEFTYHIGGFREGESALRYVEFTLPPGTTIEVNANGDGYAAFLADVAAWFARVHVLPISATGFVHSPGETAMKYADNYAGMFTLIAAGNP